jgi:hypothetical protein
LATSETLDFTVSESRVLMLALPREPLVWGRSKSLKEREVLLPV